MDTPSLHHLWLFCQMAQTMAALRTQPTYTRLLDRLRRDTRGSVARQTLWTGGLERYSLKRCVERLEEHFGEAPLREDDQGVLTLTDFGRNLAALFQPAVEQMLTLYAPPRRSDPVKVRVADSIACEVLPGVIHRLPDGGTASRFVFRRMDYTILDEEVRTRAVAFGLGWRVAESRWSHTDPVALSPPLPMVFVGSRHDFFSPEPDVEECRQLVTPARPLFIVRGELHFPGFEEALARLHLGADRVVEVVNYQAVLMHARRRDGLGIVPLLPWVLDRLRNAGAIGYRAVPGIEAQHITAYLPRGGEKKLDEAARTLLGAVKDNLRQLLAGEEPWETARDRGALPGPQPQGHPPLPGSPS